jgi:methylated-DNA-[protein]-cysteine S-methyltransferase
MNKNNTESIIITGNSLKIFVEMKGDWIENIHLSFAKTDEDTKENSEKSFIYQSFKNYLEGKEIEFDLPLNRGKITPFQNEVFSELKKRPYGSLTSYSALARGIGKENHRRAVAQALSANPFPIIIPCHRVVYQAFLSHPLEQFLGGYSYGLEIKKKLLYIENKSLVF